MSGSMDLTVPDFDPIFTLWIANIGANTDGTDITYDQRAIELKLAQPLTYTTQAAFQQFEHGFMIWLADTGQVRTFMGTSSGAADVTLQEIYQEFVDVSDGAQPPTGLIRPENAFGLVWFGYYYTYSTELGWAVSAEQSYTATLDYRTNLHGVLLSLPDGRLLHEDGYTWTMFE
jgi:hypothetical protein